MTKERVKDNLIKIFPEFEKTWESDKSLFKEEDGTYAYHGLFIEFSHFFRDNIDKFSEDQLRELFSNIENWQVKNNDNTQQLSNAVSTCFLEGIAAEGLTERIKPFIGQKSLEYYLHYDH